MSGDLRFVVIEAPTEARALRLGSLSRGDYIAEPEQLACGRAFGVWAFADAYRVRNGGEESIEVRVGVSTIRDSPPLTLAEVGLFQYDGGGVETDPHGCTVAGAPTDDHASEISSVSLAAGAAAEFLVVGGGPDLEGTYTLTVYYVSGGPDPGPDPNPNELCTDECRHARDGECDDGGDGARWRDCEYGTDCTDCGIRDPNDTCRNTCHTSNDDVCDDGGPGSEYDICDLNTDCNDCGRRE
jgi:hypothetical protein